MIKRPVLSVAVACAFLLPGVASAAQDVVVMRRVLAAPAIPSPSSQPTTPTPTPGSSDPTPTPAPVQPVATWIAGDWTSPAGCGVVTQSREVACEAGGAVVDASRCGPAPDVTMQSTDYSACSYQWVVGAWSAWSPGCSETATRTRQVQCQRSDMTPASSSMCDASSPDAVTTDGPAEVLVDCRYTAAWTAWSACTAGSETRTMTSCTRSDGAPAPLSACGDATQPQSCVNQKFSCDSPKNGYTFKNAPAVGTRVYAHLSKATYPSESSQIAAAKAYCETQNKISDGDQGVCTMNNQGSDIIVSVVEFSSGAGISSYGSGGVYAGVCR